MSWNTCDICCIILTIIILICTMSIICSCIPAATTKHKEPYAQFTLNMNAPDSQPGVRGISTKIIQDQSLTLSSPYPHVPDEQVVRQQNEYILPPPQPWGKGKIGTQCVTDAQCIAPLYCNHITSVCAVAQF
jgi:hypothetical protein